MTTTATTLVENANDGDQPQEEKQQLQQHEQPTTTRNSRARGRWKILRNALLSSTSSKGGGVSAVSKPTNDDDSSSIHCFGGFQMIAEPRLISCAKGVDSDATATAVATAANDCWPATNSDEKTNMAVALRRGLTQINLKNNDSTVKYIVHCAILDIQCSLAALAALQMDLTQTIEFIFSRPKESLSQQDASTTAAIPNLSAILTSIVHILQRDYGYQCSATVDDIDNDGQTSRARLFLQETNSLQRQRDEFCIKKYTIPFGEPILRGEEESDGGATKEATKDSTLSTRFGTSTGASTSTISVVTRERVSIQQRRITLQELVSHHADEHAMDNTGNICVWDSERTMAWAILLLWQNHLHNPQRPRSLAKPSEDIKATEHYQPHWSLPSNDTAPRRVLEMGSGMAGLAILSLGAALACDAASSSSSPQPELMDLYITDGHADCVFNNQVNERLMRAASLLPDHIRVHCRQLVWSMNGVAGQEGSDKQDAQSCQPPSLQAALTLVSDCTHFVEWQSELFWTLTHHTKVGGYIWMCQPPRAKSWSRFVRLIQAVNQNSLQTDTDGTSGPLVSLSEPNEIATQLQSRHDEILKDSTRSKHYDANIHRPYIYVLTKLREANAIDQECVVQFKTQTVG